MRVAHIGFPKTACTFLQTRVFPRLPASYSYFGKEACAPFFTPITEYDDTIFDPAAAREKFAAAWRRSKHCLFSYEQLTGSHYRSGFANRTLIAKRLRDVGVEQVIITIRNQPDALESAYRQYVKSGGTLPVHEYVVVDSRKPRYLYAEYYDYSLIYRLYAATFGAQNVLILQYEHLHLPVFIDALCRFLGVEPIPLDVQDAAVNPSLSRDKTAILRVLNHFTYSAFQPSHLISRKISTAFVHRRLASLPFLNGGQPFLQGTRRQAVAEYFARSNRELEELAGIELAPQYPRAALSARTPPSPEPS